MRTTTRIERARISEARIAAVRRMAERCDRVEFSRALPDGRTSSGMATPEDILGLLDIVDEYHRLRSIVHAHTAEGEYTA